MQHREIAMLNRDTSKYSIKSVENALRILRVISEESGNFSLSHLGAKLGMGKGYVFRMLATFERCGYVQHI